MALVTVARLDHLGLIAEVIKDIGLIEMIDTRLVPDHGRKNLYHCSNLPATAESPHG